MAVEICFEIDGKRHCWPIPMLLPTLNPQPEPPGAVAGVANGDLSQQLQAASTILAAADLLPEAQRTAIEQSVNALTSSIEGNVWNATFRKVVKKPVNGPGPDPATTQR